MGTMLQLLVRVVILVFVVKEMAGAVAVNSSCGFPFERHRGKVERLGCRAELGEMLQCLTFLLEQTPRPSNVCCAAAAKTWSGHPQCLCKITYYLPGSNVVSSGTGPELLVFCNLTANLCAQCPSLLGLLPGSSEKKPQSIGILAAVTVVCLVVVAALAVTLVVWRRRVLHFRSLPDRDGRTPNLAKTEIMRLEAGKATLFAYNVLKVATKGFHISSKLGEGGFGVVYKDGSEVAVKQLSTKSRQGKEEFLNEVMLINGVQHRNLVKLQGCCLKGQERLLVYEYLENKSLYQALFGPGQRLHLDWPTRVKILVGMARGLAYLHEGCQTRIVHRDIKSSNILLDKDLNPKIADFGLARLFTDDQSHVSTRVAGTVGYLSPEYAMRGQLTEKADVFSFGIVALELVSGRSNFNVRLPTEEAYLLDWTWTLHEGGSVLAVLDPKLMEKPYPEEDVIRVIEIALLCTQSVASMRPSMSRVVSMLAGDSEVETSNVSKPSIHTFSSSLSPASRQNLLPIEYPSRMLTSINDASVITVVIPR